MNQKDFITALVGSLLGLLPTLLSALINWREKHNRSALKEETVDFAQRQVAFLSAWLQARQQSDSSKKISGIKKEVAEELDRIKADVDKALYTPLEVPKGHLVSFSLMTYLKLRRAIGIFGIAFPYVLWLGGYLFFSTGIQESISSYYYTGMRDVYIFSLFAIGIFLLLYRGYDSADQTASSFAGIFAIGMAIFPTASAGPASNGARLIGVVHFASTLLFLLSISYISLFLFTKTNPRKPATPQKLQRNQIYKLCGYINFVLVFLIVIYSLLPADMLTGFRTVYWLESLAFVAFGISWLTKGQIILRDVE